MDKKSQIERPGNRVITDEGIRKMSRIYKSRI